MRSKTSRKFKAMGALNGFDFSDILGTVTAVANTATSVINTTSKPSTTNTNTGTANNSDSTLQSLLPFLFAGNNNSNNTPAPVVAQDNTLLYVGLGAGVLTLGTLAYVFTRPSGNKRK